jgi:hypothetical protein
MMTNKAPALPVHLDEVRRHFERWRKGRAPGTRIPETLWERAVELVQEYGLYRVGKELHLNYQALKHRVKAVGRQSRLPGSGTGFVELIPSALKRDGHFTECTVEFENRRGSRMRLHVRGAETVDLVTLSRIFWETPE